MSAYLAVSSRLNDPFTNHSRQPILSVRRNAPPEVARCGRGPAVWASGLLGFALLFGQLARAQTILGSMGGYALMAGSTVTVNGANTINGNLGAAGLAGAGSISYTPSGAPVGPISAQNQTDFTRAFTGLAAMTGTVDLTGKILGTTAGATTLTPGVYNFTSTAQLTGTLVLDAQGQSNAVWVFQVGSTFTTAASSMVTFANLAANSAANDGVFWQVGSTAVFGANTIFEGNLLVGTTISFGAAVTINHGRALTGTGQTITLNGDTIDIGALDLGYSGGLAFVDSGNTIGAIPEPATTALLAAGAAFSLALWRRCRAVRSTRLSGGVGDPARQPDRHANFRAAGLIPVRK